MSYYSREDDFQISSQQFHRVYNTPSFQRKLDAPMYYYQEIVLNRRIEMETAEPHRREFLIAHHAARGYELLMHMLTGTLRTDWFSPTHISHEDQMSWLGNLPGDMRARLETALIGLSADGHPDLYARWVSWESQYNASIRQAHDLTRALRGKKKSTERAKLYYDALIDHLDDLLSIIDDVRAHSDPGQWSSRADDKRAELGY